MTLIMNDIIKNFTDSLILHTDACSAAFAVKVTGAKFTRVLQS